MKAVLLFDIDGTLVLTGGAGRRAMMRAFARLHGRDDVFEGMTFAGMTDRAIVRHGLRRVGPELEQMDDRELEPKIDQALDEYVALLDGELEHGAGYRVLPGVTALLESLNHTPNVAVGLGTGNIKRGAYAKLARGGLDRAFAFGGFGCDAEDRAELLEAGARRGRERLGVRECRVIIIGDTPKDVEAALAIGATCVAVETGSYTADTLRELGAHRVFKTLEAPGVREALVDGGIG